MATLTVVMLLFFVLAMVAAYTNRNLVFEQRTSANSYRAAQALAAAEAGVDWSVAMLNGGTIGTDCNPSVGGNDFRTRYLKLQDDGTFLYNAWPGVWADSTPHPSCVMTDAGATCSCPNASSTSLPAENGEAPVVFRVTMQPFATSVAPERFPGVLGLAVRGCTSALAGDINAGNVNSDSSCHLAGANTDLNVDSQATIEVNLGLLSALPVAPAAALTAGGSITVPAGAELRVANSHSGTGLTLHSRDPFNITGTLRTYGPAGNPGSTELPSDSKLNLSGDAFFQALFGLLPTVYSQQPAATRVDCAGTCTASGTLISLVASNPTRVLWIKGDLDLDAAGPIGSAALPVVIVATGNVTVSAPVTLYGVVYAMGDVTWTAAGGTLIGAMVAKGNYAVSAGGLATLSYDAPLLQRIRSGYGSFVRVPGSWRILSAG